MEWDLAHCREAFRCRILLCAWHVRRTWIKKLFKKCCNIEVQREMFRHLGWILYCTKCGPNAMDAVEELMQIFVDQCAFMDYFKSHWLASIGILQVMIHFVFIEEIPALAVVASHHSQFWSETFWFRFYIKFISFLVPPPDECLKFSWATLTLAFSTID